MELSNKVAVVTGAASGLGRAAAEKLVNGGAKVVIVDMNAEAGAKAVEELGAANASFVQLDVSSGSDVEAAFEKILADLGHVDIFRGLLADAGLSADSESELFDLVQRKATRELGQWIESNIRDPQLAGWLTVLPSLTGSIEVLAAASEKLAGAPTAVLAAIAQLEEIVARIANRNVTIYLDLGELPGYHYHTGVVFAAYVQGYGKALGNGGRYDHVGEAFGRSRPATGFACNLKSLVSQSVNDYSAVPGIFVPFTGNQNLAEQVDLLRSQGNRVVQGFERQQFDCNEVNCDRLLVEQEGQWIIQKLA